MRQYAGYASAKESNERYRYLLDHGSTGLSMAFDLPTQLGLDSDDPRCLGEVGRTGVAIDSIDDMRTAFDGIPLDQVSTSMTINAPAACCCCSTSWSARSRACRREQLRGTTQNDILKEYIARGNFIYPPEGAMRLTTDLFAYCREHIPKWNTISISRLPLPREGLLGGPGGRVHARQRHRLRAGGDRRRARRSTSSRPRLAFFFNGHNNVFQEVAKFRAARRMWAADHARALRRQGRAVAEAALPHPDRRRHAHRPAAREQHRPGRAAGLRRGLRRHAVAAHQRLRRGAGAADRARREDRAAHPADHRLRVGRGRHRRPVRRLLLRRGADRRDRDARRRS